MLSSFADIFSRPMEESSDEEEEVPAAALETDLEKYLKLPELPLTMWPTGSPQTSSRGGKQRDHSLPADPQTNRRP